LAEFLTAVLTSFIEGRTSVIKLARKCQLEREVDFNLY